MSTFLVSVVADFIGAIIGITTNTTKCQFSATIGIALDWWVFLFSYPISLRDRRLIAQPGPHFISN